MLQQNGKLLGFIGILSALLQGGYVRRQTTTVQGPYTLAVRGITTCCLSLILLALLPQLSTTRYAFWILYSAATGLAFVSATVVNSLNSLASLECTLPNIPGAKGKGINKGQALGSFRSRQVALYSATSCRADVVRTSQWTTRSSARSVISDFSLFHQGSRNRIWDVCGWNRWSSVQDEQSGEGSKVGSGQGKEICIVLHCYLLFSSALGNLCESVGVARAVVESREDSSFGNGVSLNEFRRSDRRTRPVSCSMSIMRRCSRIAGFLVDDM